MTTIAPAAAPTVAETAPYCSLAAEYAGHRTVSIGLRRDLIRQPADVSGSSADDLAEALGLDPFYVSVRCRSAVAAGIVDRDGAGFRLLPHADTLLLDAASPAYVGGVFPVLGPRDVRPLRGAAGQRRAPLVGRHEPRVDRAVAGTETPLHPARPGRPGAGARAGGPAGGRLPRGGTACGSGVGAIRLARTNPRCTVAGVDGDQHSVDEARARIAEAGLSDRVELVRSALEDLSLDRPATAVNNISMHECRDIGRVTRKVREALEPGEWFVISDFPFPRHRRGAAHPTRPDHERHPVLRGADRRPAAAAHGPRRPADPARVHRPGLGVQLTPMHAALTWGRRPQER